MRVINRTAVTITGAKPCVDWTLKTDADANKGAITSRKDLNSFRQWFDIDIHCASSTWRTMTSKEKNCEPAPSGELQIQARQRREGA